MLFVPAAVIAQRDPSDKVMTTSQLGDQAMGNGAREVAANFYLRALHLAGCTKGAFVAQPPDPNGPHVSEYAFAQLLTVAAASENVRREIQQTIDRRCFISISSTGPWGGVLEPFLASPKGKMYRTLIAPLRQSTLFTRPVHILGSNEPFDGSVVALMRAADGDFHSANALMTQARTRSAPENLAVATFITAQLQIGQNQTASAIRSLANAAQSVNATPEYGALPAVSWAAAYELQHFLFGGRG